MKLSASAIAALAEALRSGHIAAPYSGIGVRQYVSESECAAVADELERLAETGMRGAHIAYVLDAIQAERARMGPVESLVELVWSGPAPVKNEVDYDCRDKQQGVIVGEKYHHRSPPTIYTEPGPNLHSNPKRSSRPNIAKIGLQFR